MLGWNRCLKPPPCMSYTKIVPSRGPFLKVPASVKVNCCVTPKVKSSSKLTGCYNESLNRRIENILLCIITLKCVKHNIAVIGRDRQRQVELIFKCRLNFSWLHVTIIEEFGGISLHFVVNVDPLRALLDVIFRGIHKQQKLKLINKNKKYIIWSLMLQGHGLFLLVVNRFKF